MSIIVALKDGDVVVLGTDSRFMNPDFTTISSDNTPKIYEIGSDGFIATGGFTMACEFQQTRAPELARELDTADIEVIGEALARESLPVMRELVSILNSTILSDRGRYENLRQKVSGESLLHGCTLVGCNSQNDAGYLTYAFWVANGEIVYERVAYFGRARKINISAALSPLELNGWTQRLHAGCSYRILYAHTFLCGSLHRRSANDFGASLSVRGRGRLPCSPHARRPRPFAAERENDVKRNARMDSCSGLG